MFDTIKSKIYAICLAMFLSLLVVMIYYTYSYLQNSKQLLTESCSNTVSFYKQRINNHIGTIADNAEDLALTGLLFYTGRNYSMAKHVITETFDNNYEGSLGGGIWFEPYVINSKDKLNCIYVYKNHSGEFVIDKSIFNYQDRVWYKQLSAKLKKTKNKIAWSTPYFDIQEGKLVITAAYGIYDNNGKLLGMSTVDCELSEIYRYMSVMKPTSNSFLLVADKTNNSIIVSTDKNFNDENFIGNPLTSIPWLNPYDNSIATAFKYNNVKYLCFERDLDNGMELFIAVPENELFNKEFAKVFILFIALISISIIISCLLYFVLRKSIKNPIDKLIAVANRISDGETDIDIKIEKPFEFSILAKTFDNMAKNVKSIITEKERMNSELMIAKSIQTSSLPNLQKIFSNEKNFDICASMEPAKEVGGDFYDGYFIDKDNYMFLIADVSGKGVPAALFMMTVKTLVNNLSQVGYSNQDLINIINKKICENNKQGFFVTMLIGIVNFPENKITYINCGHNKPLVKKPDGNFHYLDMDSNIVLGAFDEFDFKLYETGLEYGDTIFFYTDGITEAMNGNEELYGEERLLDYINSNDIDNLGILEDNIKNDVKKFIGNNPQSDDITMLIYKHKNYAADNNVRVFNKKAIQENYKDFYEWLHKNCADWQISEEMTGKIDMCAEEVYANVTFYAYPDNTDFIKITMSKFENNLIVKFEDKGIPYNPLEKPDPDISLPPEERPLGGLGIFMVKEIADEIIYNYENDYNILEIKFYL